MPKLSIIMPVYNVLPYLERAVDSVLAQTFSDFELILVDDGSTDGSGELCDALAERDGRITVIHQQNGGCSFAMGVGVSHSKGEYVCFVDSDDFALPGMCERLCAAADEHNADMVRGNILRIPFEDSPQPLPPSEQGYLEIWREDWIKTDYAAGSFDLDSFARDFFENNRHNNVFQMIIRRNIVRERCFRKDLQRATDVYFWLGLFMQEPARDMIIITIPDALYVYFTKRPGSIVTGAKSSFAAKASFLEVRLMVLDHCKTRRFQKAYLKNLKIISLFCLSGKGELLDMDFTPEALYKQARRALRQGYTLLLGKGDLSLAGKAGLTVFVISPRFYYLIRRGLERLRK